MLKNKEIIIGKYLSGNASAAEAKMVEDWIQSSETNKSEFEAAERLWNVSGQLKKNSDYNVDAAWEQFQTLKEDKVALPVRSFNWLRVAAAIVLLAVMGVLLKLVVLNQENDQPKSLSVVNLPKQELPNPNDLETIVSDTLQTDSVFAEESSVKNNRSARKTKVKKVTQALAAVISIETEDSAKIFMLPDNSIVYLNAHSKLEYPENFISSERTATLSGEAFFEVAEGYKPFSVVCDNTLTDGFLSSFNIRHETGKQVEVIVVSGSADFSGIGAKEFKKLNLKAGESGIYSKGTVIKAKHTRKNYKWWQHKSLRARIKQLFERLRNTLR